MAKSRKIQFKLVFRFSLIFIILFILVFSAFMLSFRHLTLNAAKANAYSIAETIRDGITSLMVLGVISQRDIFLQGLTDVEGLTSIKKLKIIRGQVVINQFGPPRANEVAETEMERQVFVTGETQEHLTEGFGTPIYELVIPYKASAKGRIRCLDCHTQAKEGDVLGAISISFDLSEQRSSGLLTVSLISLLTLFGIIFIFFMIYRFFTPYSAFFKELQMGFQSLERGHMDARIENLLDDEAGDVAGSFNRTMDKLQKTFSGICNNVYSLVGYEFEKSGNVITDTVYNVDQLLKIYNFKKNVEREESKYDVYLRIQEAAKKLGAVRFGIYEVDFRKREMKFILDHCVEPEFQTANLDHYENHGALEALNEFPINDCTCDLGHDLENCPVIRFRAPFDSMTTERFCKHFPEKDVEGAVHKCIPRFGTDIATIVQLVCSREESEKVDQSLPFLRSYLDQANSVLEIKQAMEFIREQSLKDELTQLYNRRYLEEVSGEFIEKYKDRRIGFLMIDIDYFKKVNDELGHDAGDLVLRGISSVIKKSVGPKDLVIRYGGEEILVLSFHTRSGETKKLAEKIRSRIEEASFPYGKDVLKKTASIGFTEYPDQTANFWFCIKYADTALYAAKTGGRNKVVRYVPELDHKE